MLPAGLNLSARAEFASQRGLMTVAETLEAMLARTTDPAARAEIEAAIALLQTWDRKAGRYVPRGQASQRRTEGGHKPSGGARKFPRGGSSQRRR